MAKYRLLVGDCREMLRTLPDESVHCVVTSPDPFAGSGTTGMVATGHGRHAVLIELNPQYADLIRDRIGPMLEETAYKAPRNTQ